MVSIEVILENGGDTTPFSAVRVTRQRSRRALRKLNKCVSFFSQDEQNWWRAPLALAKGMELAPYQPRHKRLWLCLFLKGVYIYR